MNLTVGKSELRYRFTKGRWVLERVMTSIFSSMLSPRTREITLNVCRSFSRCTPCSINSIIGEALNFVTKICWGTSLRIWFSNSLLLIIPSVAMIPICFFFVSLAASLRGGLTPIIEMSVILLLTSSSTRTEGVFEATTTNLGL
jgi:hypothetical protein